MNLAVLNREIVEPLATLLAENPLLERLFIASVELALLSLLVVLGIRLARVRSAISKSLSFFRWFCRPCVPASTV